MTLKDLIVTLNGRNVLKNITTVFDSGLYFIIGRNGSGKSTLMRAVSNLIPYAGEILLGDQEIKTLQSSEIAKHIAFLPQHAHPPFPLKVFDLVIAGRFPYLGFLGQYSNKDKDMALEALERTGIAELQNRKTTEISGGELQKALISRALCQEAQIMILDEPGQNLDPPARMELYDLLVDLSESGKTIICSTHDLEALQAGLGNLIGLKEGKLVLEKRCADFSAADSELVYGKPLRN